MPMCDAIVPDLRIVSFCSKQNELNERDQAGSVLPKLRGKCTVTYVSRELFGCWQFESTM